MKRIIDMQPEPVHFRLGFIDTLEFYKAAMGAAIASGNAVALNNLKARLGSTDLFFLLVFVCKRQDMVHPWIFDRCREVQRDPDGRLDLWAREHYKSTIITFGMTLFDIINDPEETFGIFSHTKPIAKKFLFQLKTEMEQNPDLHLLWPEIFWANPKGEAPSWSLDNGITVKRKSNPKEATVEAHGLVDGQPTSRHFGKRVYDDIVTMESVSTPEQIAKVTYAFRMSSNLGAQGGAARYAGTRYHLFDTYRVIIDDRIAILRIHAATIDGTEHGKPVLMSPEVLAEKRKEQGPYVFASQMLLNPTADKSMGFRREWLKHAEVEYAAAIRALWRFIIVDPAGSKDRKTGTKKKSNDYTAIWVLGHGLDMKYRVLDIVRDRMNLAQRTKKLMDLHRQWKPGLVAYEEYGMQADIEHIEYVQQKELYEFPIQPLGGNMKKELRILRLIPYFENGWKEGMEPDPRIILPFSCSQIDYQGMNRDLVKDFIEQEYTAFPVLDHDDMLDCLARIVDLEAANLIQTPIVQPPEHTPMLGYSRLGKQQGGDDSWVTA